MVTDTLREIAQFIWLPVVACLFVVSFYLTLRLRFIQLRKIPFAFLSVVGGRRTHHEPGEISPFNALAMVLAATVGVGSIAGVATAINYGGPGALFWIWVMAFLGMTLKYSEAVLAVRYREQDGRGEYVGGPMYYIKNGLHRRWHWLATLYALFGVFAMLGIGNMVQANTVAQVVETTFTISPYFTGALLALTALLILIGGVQRIGRVCAKLVPWMAGSYLLVGSLILWMNASLLPSILRMIVEDAFTGTAAIGGFSGALMIEALRYGVARGIFANEAGMGTAGIGHAAASTGQPVKQGCIAMFGTCIDTFIVCTLTGIVIILTGTWMTDLQGAALTAGAFSVVFAYFGELFITVCIIVFAFSTLIVYSYYGERCCEYLLGESIVKP
ncbi:MAG: amino acid carrier protein, partial [Legionellales bacterium]|nr:amino acid carrier protein [Legionellales bacterium]